MCSVEGKAFGVTRTESQVMATHFLSKTPFFHLLSRDDDNSYLCRVVTKFGVNVIKW